MNLPGALSIGGLALALFCTVTAVLAGLGSRWEWWHFRTGFQILTWAAYGGLTASVVSLAGFVIALISNLRRRLLPALIGLALGLIVAGLPWQLKQTAQRVPPIHDITTDTENPPAFVAVLPLRKEASNSADYGGPEIAAQQRAAYADVRPLILNVSPEEAFNKALEAARALGWDIVDTNPAQGRIEATDTTFWFGFKDDIVVRVEPADQGSRIDARSVSRVGKSDIGTNAKRIRAYIERMTRTSASAP
ncbi:MAG: DUF1499 domain-containing protein [Nitrospiraceae bacterium]